MKILVDNKAKISVITYSNNATLMELKCKL